MSGSFGGGGANLSFTVDSSQTVEARRNLDSLKDSAKEVSSAAAAFQKALDEGRGVLKGYAADVALLSTTMKDVGGGIDGLIDRLDRLSRSSAGLGNSMRELQAAQGMLRAAGEAYATTAAGMEQFNRVARQVGLTAEEQVSSLQRVQAALQGITAEGQRAREVMRDYGVNISGRGMDDGAAVLRELVERMRSFQPNQRRADDMQAVFGGLSIATQAALFNPDYKPEFNKARPGPRHRSLRHRRYPQENVQRLRS